MLPSCLVACWHVLLGCLVACFRPLRARLGNKLVGPCKGILLPKQGTVMFALRSVKRCHVSQANLKKRPIYLIAATLSICDY